MLARAARAPAARRAALGPVRRVAGSQRAMAAGFTPPKYHTDFAPDLVVEGIPDDPLSQPKVGTPSQPAHAPGRRCLCAARALGRRRRVRPARAHALPARAP